MGTAVRPAPPAMGLPALALALYSIAYEIVGDELVILAVAHQRCRQGY